MNSMKKSGPKIRPWGTPCSIGASTLPYISNSPAKWHAAMSDGLLPRQPVSIGSDGVRLATFSTPFTILCLAEYFLSLSRTDTQWVRWPLVTATCLHQIRWRPFADIFHLLPYSNLLTAPLPCSVVLSLSRNDTRRCPMASCHGNPSPSDPTKSVCRHFPPLSLLYFAVRFLSLLRTNTRRVRWPLVTATRLHRIWWSPTVCRNVFLPSAQLCTLLYIH